MARIEIPVTQSKVVGVERPAQVTGNSSENHFIANNDGRIVVEVENTSTEAAVKATFLTPAESGEVPVEDEAVSVPKEKVYVVGPFAVATFNQSNGQLYINPESNKLKFRAYRV